MAETDENSILDDVKKLMMIAPADNSFDLDIIIGINTALVGLRDIGVGPAKAVVVTDKSTKWSALIENEDSMSSVKSYVALRVKQLFDLAATSYTIQAREKQLEKLEWQLQVEHDRTAERTDRVDLTTLLTP